jgi:hypothetical protein
MVTIDEAVAHIQPLKLADRATGRDERVEVDV